MSARVRLSWVLSALVAGALAPASAGQVLPAGFAEDFALADDREAVLEQLVPGSPWWFYYRCLLSQHEGDLDAAAATLAQWVGQHERDSRMLEIEQRQALLGFERDREATFAFLEERLGLSFDHVPQIPGAVPDLPSRLDPALLVPETLLADALARRPGTLAGLTAWGVERLDASSLSPVLRTRLLERQLELGQASNRPDTVALVLADLRDRKGASFGSLPIHGALTLDQLQACAAAQPKLLNVPAFVDAWVRRIRPAADVDLERDHAAREAWLGELEAFVTPLAPAFNSLKAHVLFHRLQHEWALGRMDKARLLAYLRLPRHHPLRHARLYEGRHGATELVDADHGAPTDLPPIGDDGEFVRACLIDLLRDAESTAGFAELIREDELRRLFAESKLLFGVGDPERWVALMDDPQAVEALRARVELTFAPHQPRFYGPADPVTIEVDLKAVDDLLVRVFEIDAFNVYTATGRAIDASIDLDGLVANEETLHRFDEPPLRRVRRSFALPALSQPGVYVVEFVAGGRASRAVIHKGRLRHVVRSTSAGHAFRIFDDAGRPLDDASLWLGGTIYAAGADGQIRVPYSSAPGTRRIVLVHGARATLASFEHLAESYALDAGVFVDREALLPGATARLLVRPALTVNGLAASLDLLEEPLLRLVATDHDGVETTQEIAGPALSATGEFVHEFQVPERLARLVVALGGRVTHLGSGEPAPLASEPVVFPVSAIDATDEVASALLGRSAAGWHLDVLGRSGEPVPHQAVHFDLSHMLVEEPVRIPLATDERGRIELGDLSGVRKVKAAIMGVRFATPLHTWDLERDDVTLPGLLTGVAGQTLRVPYLAGADGLDWRRVAFHERRGDALVRDAAAHLALADGFLELRELPAGSYRLVLKDRPQTIAVEVSAGSRERGWIQGATRMLPAGEGPLLQIAELTADAGALSVRLAHAGAGARVHVVATRYLPPFDLFEALAPRRDVADGVITLAPGPSSYLPSRALSDEQRYVLDRRQARKFPGNMLERPTLLLNPWTLDETDTGVDAGDDGEGYASSAANSAGGFGRKAKGAGGASLLALDPGRFADLAFLPEPAVTLVNLRPGPDGVVRVPRADLGPGQLVHVLALDGSSAVQRSLALAEVPLVPRDRSLPRAFDAEQRLGESRRVDVLPAGASAVIDDAGSAQAELIDSLAGVYRLFAGLSGSDELARFAFLLRWPELSREERLQLLSDHGCHELHLFIQQHDPALFEEVLRPHLRNKLEKTFLDHWLLGDDLSAWTGGWAFSQLNVVERILLAQRVPEAGAAVQRQLRERVELMPPDPAAARRRFQAALRGSALDTAVSLDDGFREVIGVGGGGGGERVDSLVGRRGKQAAPAAAPPAYETSAAAEQLSAVGYVGDAAEADFDSAARAELRQLYRAPDRTREQVEHHYWHRRLAEQDGDLIPVNGFWLDLAEAPAGAPFASSCVAEAAGSVNEMLLALALLDLPFAAPEHERVVEGTRFTLRAGGLLLLVRKQVGPAATSADGPPMFVGQSLFRLGDRVRLVDGKQVEAPVEDEFLAGAVYEQRVVVTNPGAMPQTVELLVQVPQGALAVGGAEATASHELILGPYETRTVETHFYWPRPGSFPHYPPQVTQDGASLAAADAALRRVVTVPSVLDTGSWQHVSQEGSVEQVFDFLAGANLQALPLDLLAWRLRERSVFLSLVQWLGERQVFSPLIWSYGVHHRDDASTADFLSRRPDFVAGCGPVLESPLLSIDPVERRLYEHLEYVPLINARAHAFGGNREITNSSLAAQHERLMAVLAHRPRLDDGDWLSVTYDLLLQERIEEALAAFDRVDPAGLPGRLHHDLMAAWLAMSRGDVASARSLAERHREHPLPRWRERFGEVLAHLDEAAGLRAADDGGDAGPSPESSLELELDGGQVVLRHEHVAQVELSCFPMDVELLFSRDPFGEQDTSVFSTIRPRHRATLDLPPGAGRTVLPLPEALAGRSLLVEVRAGGVRRSVARHASALAVQLTESQGQLRVRHAGGGQPLPGVYVKVFAREVGGRVRFHKDGYTDLRGRFDYASVSGDGLGEAEEFAILVLSESDGTVIRRADAPQR